MLCVSYLSNVRLFEDEFKECSMVEHGEMWKLILGNDLGLNLH